MTYRQQVMVNLTLKVKLRKMNIVLGTSKKDVSVEPSAFLAKSPVGKIGLRLWTSHAEAAKRSS